MLNLRGTAAVTTTRALATFPPWMRLHLHLCLNPRGRELRRICSRTLPWKALKRLETSQARSVFGWQCFSSVVFLRCHSTSQTECTATVKIWHSFSGVFLCGRYHQAGDWCHCERSKQLSARFLSWYSHFYLSNIEMAQPLNHQLSKNHMYT